MRQAMVGVVLAAIAAARGVTLNAQNEARAVRTEDTAILALIAGGMERSTTFRDLKSRLDASDLIVYVRFSRCAPGIPACLAWTSAGPTCRWLRITLDRFGRSPDELTALLAHELQHANEVASARDITDQASFQKSFASRGWKHGDGFETEQAEIVTGRVAAELKLVKHGTTPPARLR